ncbi:MAG: response regulator transcription factor [Bacteroidetes bacterium]|nr:response regulator transcription factor [Bacteroidota bacterium]
MIRVLLADDHTIVRKGLRQILEDGIHSLSFGEAGNANEALSLLHSSEWDIAILDLSMPGRSGLDLLKDIKSLAPKLPVLILSMHPEEQYALRVMKAGANGYLTKDSAPEELVKAVTIIVKGRKYISPKLSEQLLDVISKPKNSGEHTSLSDREFEVMTAIASGKTVSQIADMLSLSVKTVSTYRARIFEKMNFSNNAELTRYAIQNKLV